MTPPTLGMEELDGFNWTFLLMMRTNPVDAAHIRSLCPSKIMFGRSFRKAAAVPVTQLSSLSLTAAMPLFLTFPFGDGIGMWSKETEMGSTWWGAMLVEVCAMEKEKDESTRPACNVVFSFVGFSASTDESGTASSFRLCATGWLEIDFVALARFPCFHVTSCSSFLKAQWLGHVMQGVTQMHATDAWMKESKDELFHGNSHGSRAQIEERRERHWNFTWNIFEFDANACKSFNLDCEFKHYHINFY